MMLYWLGGFFAASAVVVKMLTGSVSSENAESHSLFAKGEGTTTDRHKLAKLGGEQQGEDSVDGSEDVFNLLLEKCMPLAIDPSKVNFLPTPSHFFETLKSYIREAEHTIVISALYVGAGPLAREFVSTILQRLEENKNVTVLLILDRNRMHNSTNLVTVTPLVRQFPDRVTVTLFESASAVSQFLPYSRVREGFGVQHTKIFAFDNKKLLLTGANLADDYFTTRIDRYMTLESVAAATWYAELGKTIAKVCHPLKAVPWDDAAEKKKNPTLKKYPFNWVGGCLHKKSGLYIHPNTCGVDPAGQLGTYRAKCRDVVAEFVKKVTPLSRLPPTATSLEEKKDEDGTAMVGDTFIFPTLQLGKAGILHDSHMIERVLNSCRADGRVWLSSPYLNVHPSFVQSILDSKAHFHLITSSVHTNGWASHKGFAGKIPLFYLQLERSFYYLMESYGAGHRVWIHEFDDRGKTFHSKGLWISPRAAQSTGASAVLDQPLATDQISPTKESLNANFVRKEDLEQGKTLSPICKGKPLPPAPEVDAPFMTAIGSCNYGNRSVDVDLESEVFMVSVNSELRRKMQQELNQLFVSGVIVDERRFSADSDGRFEPFFALLAQVGQGYL